MKLGLIAEGHGEEEALPVLVRKVAAYVGVPRVEVLRPFRVRRHRLVRAGELERAVGLTARRVTGEGGVLVVLDGDEDPGCILGPELLARAASVRPDVPVAVVVAVREYEAWLLASLETMRGLRGLHPFAAAPGEPEQVAGAKEWLDRHMDQGYRATLHQAALSAALDVAVARRAPSFDKLVRDVARLLGAAAPPRGAA